MFDTVLIANRGEIALRIARTCREMGIRTVVVHSTADRNAAVARVADRCVQVGPGPSRRSYLNAAAIISAALRHGAQAVHPGYGFLSESPDFAEICAAHGLTFVGPPAEVMASLGDKAQARQLMAAAGLAVLPGTDTAVHDEMAAALAAERIGFPLIIKASSGGGGLGMAPVADPDDFRAAFRRVYAHAVALFGDGGVYLERYLPQARHIEVQVVCDTHGAAVHLGERDCSVQRRRQKLIEETPAPGLDPALRDRICAAAVAAVQAVAYVGLATVEFLVDPAGQFWFLEINCRLQVEHPVTEMVTGVDLIREQLQIAGGLPLAIPPERATGRGVALECRVNSEDPARGFTPTPGGLTEFRPPGGPFTRVDTHGYAGWQIPPYYDSLLAKVIVWAPTRDEALCRMARALGEFVVAGPGVHTTIPFLQSALASPEFVESRHNTAFVDSFLSSRPECAAPAQTAH